MIFVSYTLYNEFHDFTRYSNKNKGEIIRDFSDDAPVYSKTLDRYMTHAGVDIAAPQDTQVKAVADGTLTKVYTDDRYGITVEIDHGKGVDPLDYMEIMA